MTTNADGSAAQPTTTATDTSVTLGDAKPGTTELPIAEKAVEIKANDGPTPVAYEPSGDAGLDMALDFVGKFGIGPNDPVMVAAADGNFALLEAKLAGMGDKAKGFEKFIALGKDAHARTAEKAKADAAKNAEGIFSVVGGEANWSAIKDWAGKNAEPEEQAVVNAALNAGGMQAKAMAHYLATLYERSGNALVRGKSAVSENASSAGGGGNSGALSPREYTKEVDTLRKKLGGRLDGSREYEVLQQRRQAWRR